MTRLVRHAGVLVFFACGTPKSKPPLSDHPQPLSAAEHLDEARRHEREADRPIDPEVAGTPDLRCYDDPVEGVSTTGGQPLRVLKPCWTSVTSPSADRQAVVRHRREARAHRERAADLIGAEKRACAGLGEDEISHSPFFHREDILRIEPVRDDRDQVRGVRALFARVPGLSAAWLERAARCHQARGAVMGYSSTFMSYCPLVAGKSEVKVTEGDGGIWLRVTSDEPTTAATIWGRANALVSQ